MLEVLVGVVIDGEGHGRDGGGGRLQFGIERNETRIERGTVALELRGEGREALAEYVRDAPCQRTRVLRIEPDVAVELVGVVLVVLVVRVRMRLEVRVLPAMQQNEIRRVEQRDGGDAPRQRRGHFGRERIDAVGHSKKDVRVVEEARLRGLQRIGVRRGLTANQQLGLGDILHHGRHQRVNGLDGDDHARGLGRGRGHPQQPNDTQKPNRRRLHSVSFAQDAML